MFLESVLQQVASFTGTFDLRLVISLFLVCCIGEFGVITIPYLLETVWLLSAHSMITGALSPFQLLLLWLVAQAGRQIGAIILYHLSWFGSIPLMRLYQKRFIHKPLAENGPSKQKVHRLLHGLDHLSPLSIAMGRFMGLRIPLTMTLALRKRLGALMVGILLCSLVWDGAYLALGIAGGRVIPKTTDMALYSLAALTALYLLVFIGRLVYRYRRRGKKPGEAGGSPKQGQPESPLVFTPDRKRLN